MRLLKKIEKPIYILPKKKPLIAGKDKTLKIAKSKFYSKKDFSLAKKALSEMKKIKLGCCCQYSKKSKR